MMYSNNQKNPVFQRSSQARTIRVLFATIGYAPPPIPSDKQFVNDLIEHLPEFIEPAVWTISEIPPSHGIIKVGHKQILLTSKNRLGHQPLSKNINCLVPHPKHSSIRNMLEISTSVLWEVFHSLKEATLQHQADVIHFIDNVGPILPLIRYMLPTVHISFGKPSARVAFSKGWWFYKQLLNFSYKTSDCVVTYSETCKNSLVSSGIESGQIRVVPWGIKIPQSLSTARIHEIRTKYGCSATRNLLVVGLPRGDLHKVVAISKEISKILPTIFVFAIRPTLYKDAYATLSDEYVKIIKGPEDFHDLLAAADIAFADQPSSPSTSLPPLAWLEAMVRSTPVITRNVPGMEETVKNNVTGFIYEEVTELKEILAKVAGDRIFLEQLQKQSCTYVTQKHNIESIAIQYADIWHKLCLSKLETNNTQ